MFHAKGAALSYHHYQHIWWTATCNAQSSCMKYIRQFCGVEVHFNEIVT